MYVDYVTKGLNYIDQCNVTYLIQSYMKIFYLHYDVGMIETSQVIYEFQRALYLHY